MASICIFGDGGGGGVEPMNLSKLWKVEKIEESIWFSLVRHAGGPIVLHIWSGNGLSNYWQRNSRNSTHDSPMTGDHAA